MTRAAITSDSAPEALGPYSQAIVAGGFVFCSGMAGIDPATGVAAEGIAPQTAQALVNLAAVLEAFSVISDARSGSSGALSVRPTITSIWRLFLPVNPRRRLSAP
jgi:enamine deaminase RidA (YjgF/YER057c/UK114 family)